jgi:anhydro-N-acetylmuramic acid kinase
MSSLRPLSEGAVQRPLRVIGLMSGTSLDGVDAALIDLEGPADAPRVTLKNFFVRPFSDAERQRIHGLFTADARTLTVAHFWLGELFADAALGLLESAGVPASEVDLIGSHGQTIWHQPPSSVGPEAEVGTLQLGAAAVIAARTGVLTAADFRTADVAVGGEGAPLVPYADFVLYRHEGRRRALQNIGGIANVTLVGDRLDETIAFDTGPGNMMLDALMPLVSNGSESFDRDGAFSAQGEVDQALLAELLDDDYLRQPPPKSTGRERYGRQRTLAWAAAHSDRRPVDLLRTLVELAARSIADAYHRFLPQLPDEVLVSGGGAHNRTLLRRLGELLAPIPVRAVGTAIEVDAKEAVAFALLGAACLAGIPANVPSVTGARCPAVLGALHRPPPAPSPRIAPRR